MATEERLIDANALKIHRMHNAGANHPLDVAYRKDIDNAPTVDAVEVVRCKDCKHTREKSAHEQFMYNENVYICAKEDIWGITKNEPVWDDWFCSYGERRRQ